MLGRCKPMDLAMQFCLILLGCTGFTLVLIGGTMLPVRAATPADLLDFDPSGILGMIRHFFSFLARCCKCDDADRQALKVSWLGILLLATALGLYAFY